MKGRQHLEKLEGAGFVADISEINMQYTHIKDFAVSRTNFEKMVSLKTQRQYGRIATQYDKWEADRYWRDGLDRETHTKEKITIYLNYLMKEGKSPSTIRTTVAAINWYMKNFLELSQIEFDNLPPVKQTIPNWLEHDEAKKLIENTPYLEDKALIVFLLDTGMRISEALNVKIEHINFAENTVMIEKRKGKYIPQAVPFGEKTKNILIEYIGDRKRGRLFDMNMWKAQRHIKKLGYAILGKKITPHVLRHTKAVALRKAGVSLEDIADYLGHSSLESTRRYARITATHLKQLPQTL